MSFLVDSKVFADRMAVCESCEFYTKLGTCGTVPGQPVKYQGRTYRLCGCPMKVLKGRLSISQCPVGKWGGLQLKSEQIAKAKELLRKYTDKEGKIITQSINPNELVGLWQVMTGEVAQAGCSGCVKELIRAMQPVCK